MNRLFKVALCTTIALAGIFAVCMLTPYPARAVQTIYGAVYGWKYVTPTEVLWTEVTPTATTSSGVNYTVTYSMKCMDGRSLVVNSSPAGPQAPSPGFTPGSGILVDQYTFQIQATNSFTGYGKNFPCEGWLMTAGYTHDSGVNFGMVRGLVYIQLEIMTAMPAINGATAGAPQATQFNGYILANLLCTNAPSNYAFSWPEHGCDSPDIGMQLNLDFAGGSTQLPNPGAAANWTFTPNVSYHYKVINISYTLASSATAGNRFSCVTLVSSAVIVAGPFCSPYAQQASQTVTYEFASGVGWATNCSFLGATQTAVLCPSVEVPLPTFLEFSSGFDGVSVQSCVTAGNGGSCTSGFQTGDQISLIHVRTQITHETS